MKLLLTGFEPFAGSTVNPSQMVALRLADQQINGLDIAAVILPVDNLKAPEQIIKAIQTTQPDAVVCLGQATRRMAVSIERVAVNLMDYSIPDNAGRQPVDEPVVAGGPAAYFVTLPVKKMLLAVRAAGVPGELSLSAGAYACNHILYHVLHHIDAGNLPVMAGFIHLPALPEQAATHAPLAPSMSLETMLVGVTAALEAIPGAQPGG